MIVVVGLLPSFLLGGCGWLTKSDLGKQEFESKCATCHGMDGRGDGPQAEILSIQPANLTILAKQNGGVFPVKRVHAIIDGRLEVAAHGPRTMPIWGREFQVNVPDLPVEATGSVNYREDLVQGKIRALIDYLKRIQE